MAQDPTLINNIERMALKASESSAAGADKAWNMADTLKAMAENHPAVVAAIDKLTAVTEKNGDKIAGAVGNGNGKGSGPDRSGRALADLAVAFAEDTYRMSSRR
jgi:hypothetical protein